MIQSIHAQHNQSFSSPISHPSGDEFEKSATTDQKGIESFDNLENLHPQSGEFNGIDFCLTCFNRRPEIRHIGSDEFKSDRPAGDSLAPIHLLKMITTKYTKYTKKKGGELCFRGFMYFVVLIKRRFHNA